MTKMLTEEEIDKLRGTDEYGHWRDPAMNTESVWRQALIEEGHIAFALDDIEYFIVPLAPHAYGLNTWAEYKANRGYPKWTFQSEDELLNAKLFGGRSILERLFGTVDASDQWGVYLRDLFTKDEGTPFKIAYRSRNETMTYCHERVRSGVVVLSRALDEATSMKVLSRIEGEAPMEATLDLKSWGL